MPRRKLTQEDYAALAEFRYLLRCFLDFSEQEAKRVGLTPRQHQALLVIKGYGQGNPVSIGELAERLKIQHNSAVELVSRLIDARLVERSSDLGDQRRVLLSLTASAERCLGNLSSAHFDELFRLRPLLEQALRHYS